MGEPSSWWLSVTHLLLHYWTLITVLSTLLLATQGTKGTKVSTSLHHQLSITVAFSRSPFLSLLDLLYSTFFVQYQGTKVLRLVPSKVAIWKGYFSILFNTICVSLF